MEQAIERGVLSEKDVTAEKLQGFVGGNGRAFYRVHNSKGEKVIVKKDAVQIQSSLQNKDGSIEVIPFRRGQKTWSVEWK